MARSLELRCCGTAGLRGWVVWARVNEGGVARVGRAWRHSYGGDRSGIRGLPEGAAAPTSPRPPLAHNALPRRSPTRLHPTRSLSLAPSLYRSLSLLLVGNRGVRASRTFPADFSRGESASDARIVSWGCMGKGRTVGPPRGGDVFVWVECTWGSGLAFFFFLEGFFFLRIYLLHCTIGDF